MKEKTNNGLQTPYMITAQLLPDISHEYVVFLLTNKGYTLIAKSAGGNSLVLVENILRLYISLPG